MGNPEDKFSHVGAQIKSVLEELEISADPRNM